MTLIRSFSALAIAAAALAAAPAQANSLTFQGVTFETLALDANTLELDILNATHATGDWAGIGYIKAFSIKDVGTITGASLAGWTENSKELSANGCRTGNSGGACFTHTPALALTDSMSFVIHFTGTSLHFDNPHLKVEFLSGPNDTRKTGSLLSMNIPAVPEPETYAMLLAGLGAVGFVARRRRQG